MSGPWFSWLMHYWYSMRALRAVERFRWLATDWYDRAVGGRRL